MHTILLKWLLRLALILPVLFFGSCALGAKPFEREVLGDPIMLPDDDPDATKMEEHMLQYREGTSGGKTASGGGCGC